MRNSHSVGAVRWWGKEGHSLCQSVFLVAANRNGLWLTEAEEFIIGKMRGKCREQEGGGVGWSLVEHLRALS